jgi:hypothetical protein
MRTKTLLLTAALGAAGVASALAQVYSVNAVGYVNVTAKPGFNLLNNPLDAGANNTVKALMPADLPEGSIVYTYNGTTFRLNTYEFGEWTYPTDVLVPGTGFFLRMTGTADKTITFVGEVKQGTLTTPLIAGFNLVGSQVPQEGLIQTILGFVPGEGDVVYNYSSTTGNYTLGTFEFGIWDPQQPRVGVGEGLWIRKIQAGNWTRTFSVNP